MLFHPVCEVRGWFKEASLKDCSAFAQCSSVCVAATCCTIAEIHIYRYMCHLINTKASETQSKDMHWSSVDVPLKLHPVNEPLVG